MWGGASPKALRRGEAKAALSVRLFLGLDYYGAGNFGDDLMLAGFLRAWRAAAPEATVSACTPHAIESQRGRFPDVRWLPNDDEVRERELREADVWVGLGDTPFQLESGPWMLDHLERERERCERFRVPMVFVGVGCESHAAASDPRATAVLANASRLWARDAFSAELLAEAAPANAVELGADLAHVVLAGLPAPSIEDGLLGMLFGMERRETVDVLALEDAIARRAPRSTRWLVQETRTFPYTERWNYAALSEWTQRRIELMPLDYDAATVPAFFAAFGAPETVVSSRYHGALVAAWRGCRTAVIARTGKVAALAEELRIASRPRVAAPADLEGLAAEARQADTSLLQGLGERARAMCAGFAAWCESLG